jgi:hypothetical protein
VAGDVSRSRKQGRPLASSRRIVADEIGSGSAERLRAAGVVAAWWGELIRVWVGGSHDTFICLATGQCGLSQTTQRLKELLVPPCWPSCHF